VHDGWRGPPLANGVAVEGHHYGGYHDSSIFERKEILLHQGNCMTRRLFGLTLCYLPVLVSTVSSVEAC